MSDSQADTRWQHRKIVSQTALARQWNLWYIELVNLWLNQWPWNRWEYIFGNECSNLFSWPSLLNIKITAHNSVYMQRNTSTTLRYMASHMVHAYTFLWHDKKRWNLRNIPLSVFMGDNCTGDLFDMWWGMMMLVNSCCVEWVKISKLKLRSYKA